MQNPPKCLLLPIDGTEKSLRPVEFIRWLYPVDRDITLILCYFIPPLPPAYSSMVKESRDLMKKKTEFLKAREDDTSRIFENAKKVLLRAGFSEGMIQEHVQQREMTVAKHACLLADIKKVDAILVQKTISSSLEGFLKGNSPSALLRHCLASPIWFTEGEIDPKSAAICIFNEEASLRIADHAGYMLSETLAVITLLHATRSLSSTVVCSLADVPGELAGWRISPAGVEMMPYLMKSAEIVQANGVEKNRIRIALIPQKGDTAQEILAWCHANGTGIIGLGHSEPEGIWGFLKTSVTRKILSEFKNMAIWVTQ
jgi:nucleotide-binding universal stress UspA family protein